MIADIELHLKPLNVILDYVFKLIKIKKFQITLKQEINKSSSFTYCHRSAYVISFLLNLKEITLNDLKCTTEKAPLNVITDIVIINVSLIWPERKVR